MPRSMFNTDQWIKPLETMEKTMGKWIKPFTTPFTTPTTPTATDLVPYSPTTLDLFDPFDELDHTIGRNMQWLNKPDWMPTTLALPKVPQKYRITVDIFGYSPESIKTEWVNNKLVVTGKEEVKHEGEDFSVKQFKKTYEVPVNADHNKLVSFVTGHGQLVLEVPLKEAQFFNNAELFPQIVDHMDGGKEVFMNCTLPTFIDPTKVHVTCKDRDIIIKAEDIKKKPDGITKYHYYKRSTMPENTKFEEMKCTFDNNMISFKAPLDMEYKPHHWWKHVPIEYLHGKPCAIGGPVTTK